MSPPCSMPSRLCSVDTANSRVVLSRYHPHKVIEAKFPSVHGEKNLGLNARELVSFTRGLLVVRMPQASLAMFTMTSCVQCTTSSLVLNAPTQLRESLKSFGLTATLRCAKSVKLTTRYFQEIPRTFSVRFLAIAF